MIKIDADRSFCKRAQLEAARATMKVIPLIGNEVEKTRSFKIAS